MCESMNGIYTLIFLHNDISRKPKNKISIFVTCKCGNTHTTCNVADFNFMSGGKLVK